MTNHRGLPALDLHDHPAITETLFIVEDFHSYSVKIFRLTKIFHDHSRHREQLNDENSEMSAARSGSTATVKCFLFYLNAEQWPNDL